MITKDGSTKLVNFMTPGAGVLVLKCGHLYALSSTLSKYSTLIPIVFREYDAAFLANVD